VLEVDEITVRAANGRAIVSAVSLAARPGELVAILGPNGAGKSTLIEAIVGLRPAAGRVAWCGRPLDRFAARAATFSFMPDEATLPEEASVRLVLGGDHGAALGLAPLWDRPAGSLSRGEAKRVWLAWTLRLERPVIVLDEPFGAFDPIQLDGVLAVVKERASQDAAILATVHQMSTAERVADKIALLSDGKLIAFGTLDELRDRADVASSASLEEVFRALVGVVDAARA
jgi:ABC-type multidrug transport system ATPase subunit